MTSAHQHHRLLDTGQLAAMVGYSERTLRETLAKNPSRGLKPGRHYARRPGRRKILFNWTAIAADMGLPHDQQEPGDLVQSEEMASAIQYDVRTLRERLVGNGLLRERQHYFFLPTHGARTILFLRRAVVDAMGFPTVPVTFDAPPEPARTDSVCVANQPDLTAPPPAAFVPTATDFWIQAAEFYLNDLPPFTRQATVLATRTAVHRDLTPYFATRTCSEITLADVSFALEGLTCEHGRSHANLCFRVLQGVFECATKLWRVPSPIKHLLSPPRADKLPRVLRINEVARLIAVAPEHYRPYFIVRTLTGLSNEEAHSLRGRSVLLDTAQLRVDEIRVGSQWQPLSEGRTRTITMSRMVKEAIVRLRAATSGLNQDDLVFVDPQGKPLDNARVATKVFAPMLHAAGIQPMLLRELANTAPYLMLCANHAPEDVAEWCGYGDDVEAVLRRFKRQTLQAEGFTNLDRLLMAGMSDEARLQFNMPLALPTEEQ